MSDAEFVDDLDPEEVELLRELVREALAEEAPSHEELVMQLSVRELFELVEELDMEKAARRSKSFPSKPPRKSAPKIKEAKKVQEAKPRKAGLVHEVKTQDPVMDSVVALPHEERSAIVTDRSRSVVVESREVAFTNPSPERSPERADFLQLKGDDDYFDVDEGVRALLQSEVAKLCKNTKSLAEAAQAPEEAPEQKEDPVEAERQRMLAGARDEDQEVEEKEEMSLTPEQLQILRFSEELELKSELHHKAIMHGLTKVEAAELFELHGLDAPKEGDFQIVKQLMAEGRNAENARLGEDVRNISKRVKMRWVDNELVQTKDKQVLEAKDHNFIRATTTQLTLIGNSSKARMAHRLIESEDTGPKASAKGQKKKRGA